MPTNVYVRSSGVWKNLSSMWVRDSGRWRAVKDAYIRDQGVWKHFKNYKVVPEPPKDIIATSATSAHNRVTLAWTNQVSLVTVAGIILEVFDMDNNSRPISVQVGELTTSYEFTGLTQDTVYVIRMRTVTPGGITSAPAMFGWYTGIPPQPAGSVAVRGWSPTSTTFRVTTEWANPPAVTTASYPAAYISDGDDRTGWASVAIPFTDTAQLHQGFYIYIPASVYNADKYRIDSVSIRHLDYPEDISISLTDAGGTEIRGAGSPLQYANQSPWPWLNFSTWGYSSKGSFESDLAWSRIPLAGWGGAEAVIYKGGGGVRSIIVNIGPNMTEANRLAVVAVVQAMAVELRPEIILRYLDTYGPDTPAGTTIPNSGGTPISIYYPSVATYL